MSRKSSIYIRVLLRLVLLALLLSITSIIPNKFTGTIPAQAQWGIPRLFMEDFDDGEAQNWDLNVGDNSEGWEVIEGSLVGNDSAMALYDGAEFSDGALAFYFYPNANSSFTVHRRMLDDGSQESVDFIIENLSNQIDRLGEPVIRILYTLTVEIYKQVGENEMEMLASDKILINLGNEYRGGITTLNGSIVVSVYSSEQSETVMRIEIEDPQPLPHGKIAFEAMKDAENVQIDNIIFASISGEDARYLLSGQVFERFGGQNDLPLEGVEVSLFTSEGAYPDPGEQVDSTITGPEGEFTLRAPIRSGFFSIRQTRIPGYNLVDSDSSGGIVRETNWIEFEWPLWEFVLDGNFFWNQRIPTWTPTSTSTATVTPTGTNTPTGTPLPTRTATSSPTSTATIQPTPSPTLVPSLTPTEGNGSGEISPWTIPMLFLGGLAGLTSLGGLIILIRFLRNPPSAPPGPPEPSPEKPPEGPQEPEPEPEQQPVFPILPPLRLIRTWLTEGAGRGGRLLREGEPLVAGAPYSLHIQVQPGGAQFTGGLQPGAGAQPADLQRLNLAFFSPEEDFTLDRSTANFHLSNQGASNEIRRTINPIAQGQSRVRVCVYYGNVLLQSALLEAAVVLNEGDTSQGRTTHTLDYIASPNFSDLEGLVQPSLNIFTNRTSDGTHWIGVFSESASTAHGLRSGSMQTFSDLELNARAREMRELLATIQGPQPYRYSSPLPIDETKLQRTEQDLIALAERGWKVFHSLFLARVGEVDYDRLPDSAQPGLISIARCNDASPTIPWAALYDLQLRRRLDEQYKLCDVFKTQLTTNKWNPDQTALVEKHDLLDNMRACRALAHCPLKGPQELITVCPFGFWGFTHQIEQPLQSVKPTRVDQVPAELQESESAEKFTQTSFLRRVVDEKVRILMGAYPEIHQITEHYQEILAAGPKEIMELAFSEDRDQVLTLLEGGGRHMYYFYCHGRIRDGEFRLLLGPPGGEAYISASNLDPRRAKWRGELHPLVILNGCETMRLTPELMNLFLGVLKQMGASGVVGSEIPVHIFLARPVGAQLVHHLLSGLSIGESFLVIRRHLARQGNPLGLAYSHYSPASLHLHDPDSCQWCRSRLNHG